MAHSTKTVEANMHKIKKHIIGTMLFLSMLTITALADTASNAGKVITVKAQTIKTVLNYNGKD